MSAFSPRAVIGLVLAGALSFILMLWFIGQGDTGPGPDNGEGHAASHGLIGYAGIAALLETQGHDVSMSRSQGRLDDEVLLVLTPPPFADADDVAEVIRDRRYAGPTLLILPKWFAAKLPARVSGAREGWVAIHDAQTPRWTQDLADELEMQASVAELPNEPAPDWRGMGVAGRLPERFRVQGLDGGPWTSLVRDAMGRDLVAYADDAGCYPVLDAASGQQGRPNCDEAKWNVTVVFEPDLFNNYGLADRDRAELAAAVVDLAREGQDLPVVFDLTMNGFGAARNLVTLAFTPPFLAATLCLLIALAIVAWRAFGRFGPPIAEEPAIAFGKTRLAADSGGLVRRSGRLHLLGPPYAAMIERRLAAALGVHRARGAALDAAIAARAADAPAFTRLASDLETARGPSATLRAAHALYSLERTIAR
ncbi:DUF4350 domain-containing protein [Altererythrobacter aerius]|uniref:DUF4350 domain-containing protein n=1 Tax=Tsuneonella aeria TaxID=1837929 RepID=A0A6I4TEY3_9SPHN|nr:DUF4350 domain-containing protein [Tsuneonella aeria]MXO74978.1 DUF4350 domain-containing protein [Tsuneonella aeria]